MALTKNAKMNWLAAVAALPITFSIQMTDTPLKIFMVTLIFYVCIEATLKQIVTRAIIVGATASIINFFWLIGSANNYTGRGYLLGVGFILVFTVFFSCYTAFIGLVYYYLMKWKRPTKWDWVYTSISGGAFAVLLEYGMEHLGKGFAMCLHLNYIAATTNVFAIQPASILGPTIITCVFAVFNYQVAYFLYYRQYKKLWIPAVICLLYIVWGMVLYYSFKDKVERDTVAAGKSFEVAILSENMLPDEVWNSRNGDFIARDMFELARLAAKGKANLAVWSESAIPWAYRPDDDFIHVLDSLTSPYGMTHLLGINTEYKPDLHMLYNSVYCIEPHMKATGRYAKREALSLVEKPFMGVLLPFYTNNGFQVKEGTSDLPLNTPYGKAGMMLCNESVITHPAWSSVDNGAQFLVAPGNDGWFANTYLAKQHFAYDRLRAVETRKDVVVDNNNGYCGMIKASGDIVFQENNDGPKVSFAAVTPNDYRPIALRASVYFVLICGIIFVFISVLNFIQRKPLLEI
ncbi:MULTISPECIES: apolipoprotein N-acyltransferase [Chitinophagaceae]